MCRIGDGDPADVYNVQCRLARKEHRCGECFRTILAGEPYDYHTWVADGTAGCHKVCSHCAVLSAWINRDCGGTLTGQLIEDIEEHAQDYHRLDLAELAKAARGKWESFRGHPMPVCPPPLTAKSET